MNRTRSSNKYSRLILILIAGWFLIYPCFRNNSKSLSWDVFGYYSYLPAKFIWKDIALKDFSPVEKINKKYELTPSYYQFHLQENGNQLMKYTCGVAVAEAPFFFAAHALAPSLGYERDGYSPPYQYAMVFAGLCWVIAGFFFLRKTLLRFFSDRITAVVLALLMLGTNLYITVLLSPGMTHLFEFGIISIVLYLTVLWYEKQSVRNSILLGFFIGLAALVRPPDGLIILVPLCWKMRSFAEIGARMKFLFVRNWKNVAIILFCMFLAGLPQLLYWYSITGKFIITKYGDNPGEGFSFLHPHILNVLFSFRKGWLLYTPLMILALIGLIQLFRKRRDLFFPIFIYFLFNLYVVSSWSCWWYAASFSSRALVESYPVMAIPLAFFIGELSGKKWLRITGISLLSLFTLLNIFQSMQYSAGVIDGERMTRKYYFRTFGKMFATPDDQKLLLIDRSVVEEDGPADLTGYKKEFLAAQTFETVIPDLAKNYCDTLFHNGKRSYRLDSNWVFSPGIKKCYTDITKGDHAWIESGFWFYPTTTFDSSQLSMVVTFLHKGAAYKYIAIIPSKTLKDVKVKEWNYFKADYLTPEVRDLSDTLNVYFWLRDKSTVFVDDLEVNGFTPPEE